MSRRNVNRAPLPFPPRARQPDPLAIAGIALALFAVGSLSAVETSAALSRTRPSSHGRVVSQKGRRVQVVANAGAAFAPGMPVWISERGKRDRGGLPVCEGRVLLTIATVGTQRVP